MESYASGHVKFASVMPMVYVAHALSGVRKQFPDARVYHYMDDILVATPTQDELLRIQPQLLNALHSHGLQVAPEKGRVRPWKLHVAKTGLTLPRPAVGHVISAPGSSLSISDQPGFLPPLFLLRLEDTGGGEREENSAHPSVTITAASAKPGP
ncbi:hypothetical protein DUI87_27404 [Hirundo rustica rustica]|uniref:ribonuclease H n=1 Tax=Hirundo rustica rustica TaxID=333673 RepID=A0A3M0J5B6_HIRRU|nr:hypothetical protein DUI87_27404 [Hirundo rustica rustica]